MNLGDARRVEVLARLDFVLEPGKFVLDLSQKVVGWVVGDGCQNERSLDVNRHVLDVVDG